MDLVYEEVPAKATTLTPQDSFASGKVSGFWDTRFQLL